LVALFVFLATAAIVSELSAQAKRRTEEAVTGRNEIGRLYELSRAMLMDEARDAVRVSVTKTGQILQLRHVAFYDAAANQIYGSLDDSKISQADLVRVAETGERSGDGDYPSFPSGWALTWSAVSRCRVRASAPRWKIRWRALFGPGTTSRWASRC